MKALDSPPMKRWGGFRGEARNSTFQRETLTDLAKAQRPYATVLGCSDSRVPPEWISDTGLGELFVIRVAGNVFSPEIAGTLQYAASYLETSLFVILGHEGCGAITAALATKHEGEQFPSRLQVLLANIVPGLPDFDPSLSPAEQGSCAVESNVRWTVRQILDLPEGLARMAEGRIRIVGAVYEIETGCVRFLPPAKYKICNAWCLTGNSTGPVQAALARPVTSTVRRARM